MTLKRFRAFVALLAGALLLSGCDFSVYKLPLPGGPDVGEDPIEITVMFDDVLDLVPQSTVKVNDISVGKVTDIGLEGQHAKVTLQLQEDVELPDNAVAQLRQTSLLGEKFVALSPPPGGASDGLLESGDTIGLEDTGRNPEVEEVLGALSLLLNGGGVAQLKTIASELNLALEGREDSAKSVLRQIRLLMSQLDEGKGDIVDAIESLNRLALSVKDQLPTIDAALEELPSALTSIDRQRRDLVEMLQALNRLGDVGVRVIRASKASTIETFEQLVPVLTELGNTGDNFAKAFHVFLTYPFVDEVVGRDPQVARNLHMGDFTNLSVQLDVSICLTLEQIPEEGPIDPRILCDAAQEAVQECLDDPSVENCEGLPDVLLDEICEVGPIPGICEDGGDGGGGPLGGLDDVLGGGNGGNGPLGDVDLPGNNGGGGGNGGGNDGGGILDGDGPLGGLPRPGYGPTTDWGSRGPTMRELTRMYDESLVSLLVPGMVVGR